MTEQSMTLSKPTSLRSVQISALTLAMLFIQSNIAIASAASIPAANPQLQIINNVANASYHVNSQNDTAIATASNQVQVKASHLPEYGIGLTQQPVHTVMPNAWVNWVNVLSNTSYSNQTVELTLDISPTLSNVKIYQDLNKNGIEPPRDCRRLNILREYDNEKTNLHS